MMCPYCGQDNDRVIDSRSSQGGDSIRRRRECLSCKKRFTTYERLEEIPIKVVKRDNSRQPFSREKLRAGIAVACWKRPISDEEIDSVVAKVEADIYGNFDTELDSHHLGELVMEKLGRIDEVAFVRFASVYQQFKTAKDFYTEIGPMLAQSDDD
jgi:transcriptional repressor NrdR